MKYNSIDDILPREQPDVKATLSKFSQLVCDAVNFGTHLMKWDIERKMTGDENIVPALFLRNILDIADSISILIETSSIDPSKSSLRILLENVLGIEYLLEKDTRQRALSFIVWLTMKDFKFYEKLDGGTEIGKQIRSEFKKDKLIQKGEILDNVDYTAAKKNAEELLSLPHYAPIADEYRRSHLKSKNPNWYGLFSGPKNIELLAKYLNRNAIYEVMYRKYSANVHAIDIFKGKLLVNNSGTADIIQIRNPKDAQSVVIDTINYLLIAYYAYIKNRIPEKSKEFSDWYSEFRIDFERLRSPENEIIYK